jgi:hypothetical protein
MKKCFINYSITKISLVAVAMTLFAAGAAQAGSAWARGGNWAATDGLVSNVVAYPDGITSSTTTTQAAAVADTIANDYDNAGINFVRYPVNPATVSGNWAVTQAAINELIADGMMVDICCWYVDPQPQGGNGLIVNMTTWENMWKTVDGVYKNNNAVYYEPINEPSGYSATGLESVYTTFLGFINKSQNHILLGGTGYEDNVTAIGGDSSFNNCLLAVHDYAAWEPYTTASAWSTDLYNRVHPYQSRTIMTEMGAVTTSGLNYEASSSDSNICFVQGMCNQSISWGGMGLVWFPADQAGTGNNKRMFNGPGEGIINRSLVNEMQYGWDFYTPVSAAVSDFNVIGKTDFATFRPSNNSWEIQSGGGGAWGASGDIAVPADYAGDGTVQMATWRPSNYTWYLDGVSGGGAWGTAGDIPVPADYNGTGQAQLATFRPSNGTWYVNGGGGGHWGTNGDIPVPGYYNGDGHADMAVYRPSNNTWYIDGGATVKFGTNGDIPVPGDYTGSGLTQIAMWRPSNGTWYIYGVGQTQFGQNGDVPVPGDYNNSGETEMAVWRPSNNTWYVYQLSGATWGATGDIPLPLPYAIRHYSLGYTQ